MWGGLTSRSIILLSRKYSAIVIPVYTDASRAATGISEVLAISTVRFSEDRVGSLTAVGAVSPPGGDLSEPVSQGTMRIVKVFRAQGILTHQLNDFIQVIFLLKEAHSLIPVLHESRTKMLVKPGLHGIQIQRVRVQPVQNAFMDVDSCSTHDRQMRLLAMILDFDR